MIRVAHTAGLALLLAPLLALPACGGVTPFAAIVNGDRLSRDHLVRELKDLGANKQFVTEYDQSATQNGSPGVFTTGTAKPTYSQQFVAAVLGLDVQASVVHVEVVRRHAQPPANSIASKQTHDAAAQPFDVPGQPSVFDQFSPWLKHEFEQRQAEQDALGAALGAQPVSDAAVQQFYDQNPGDFITSQCVSHILVKTQDQAVALRAQVAAGASFATLAQQNSIDTATAAKGGSLGCGPPNGGTSQIEQDTAFAQAAVSTPPNQVSQPIQTSLGFDLLEVTNRQLTPLSDTVKQEIRQQLQQQSSAPLNAFFQQAAKTLKVTINPEYGSWDTQQLKVDPPAAPPARAGGPGATTPLSPGAQTPGGQPGASTPPSTPDTTPQASTPPSTPDTTPQASTPPSTPDTTPPASTPPAGPPTTTSP